MKIEAPTFAHARRYIGASTDAPSDSVIVNVAHGGHLSSNYSAISNPTSTLMLPVTRRQFLGMSEGPVGGTSREFSEMTPSERVAHLWKSNPGELAFLAIGFAGSVYIMLRAFAVFVPGFSFISDALAQENGTVLPSFVTSRDAFDWMVGGVMSVAFIISLVLTFFASSDKKIDLGSGMSKLLAGFLAGFLTSNSS